MLDTEGERQRFLEWTFERELNNIEDHLGGFDRNSPSADLGLARFKMELDEIAPPPSFLGHQMRWWVRVWRDHCLYRDGSSPSKPTVFDHLGIRDAVEQWDRSEKAFEKNRAKQRRAARRAGRTICAK